MGYIRSTLANPEKMIVVHTWMAIIWALLSLATTIAAVVFPDNRFLLAWVIFMSGYANTVGHWAARQGAAPNAE
jgi:hypothetical protein